jgi:hypothetical protein
MSHNRGGIMRYWLFLSLLLPAAALAQSDVGLVHLVKGEVSYTSAGGTPAKVTAFMKVREGDRFSVPAGGQVRVVYFQGSRQESFAGPARFTTGALESSVQSGAQPQVTQLPAGVPQRIARVPELMQNAKLGGVQVRGSPPASKRVPEGYVQEAHSTYESLRKSLPGDDITPELYLYSALNEYRLYEDMGPVIQEMQRKQPANDDVKALADWLKTRRGR